MDQAPELGAIGRFFLSAPLFLFLAGAIFAGTDPLIFMVFAGSKLAGLLHLVTLGFLSMVMMGALLQMLPVVAGVKIKAALGFARIIHALYVTGVLLFAWVLYSGRSEYMIVALFCLSGSVFVYIVTVFSRLLPIQDPGPSVRAMKFALLSFFVVAALGTMMAAVRVGAPVLFSEPAPMMVHYGWAVGGWVMILIAGVSYRVIPMFYVASDYPLWMSRYFAPVVFFTLILYSLTGLLPQELASVAQKLFLVLLHLAAFVFVVVTLHRIRNRKRKLPDLTLRFWYLAGASVMVSVALWGVSLVFPHFLPARLPIFWGFFALAGGAISVVTGMSYKIVPFLSWFHLTSRGIFSAPTIKSFISDFQISLQFWFHFAALLATLAALIYPGVLTMAAGLLWSLSALFMFFSFAKSLFLNRKLTREAAETQAPKS